MLFKLSIKNLLDRPLRSSLSILLLTLGVAMISFVIVLGEQLNTQFTKNIKSTDMVVGAKGSPLQLILSAIYHIDAPTGNVPAKEALRIAKHPLVKSVIPMAYGDYYKGYRILGTTYSYPVLFDGKLKEGRWWNHPLEVCVGAKVASKTGLKIGDQFLGMHGTKNDGHVHEENAYRVVGIFEPSNSVLDQLVLCNIESVWKSHDHSAEEHEHHHDHHHHHKHENKDFTPDLSEKTLKLEGKKFLTVHQEKEITAMLVKFRSPMANVQLPRLVNSKTSMQAALPSIEITRLFDLLGIGIKLFNVIAWVIVFTAGISLFISLYNSLKEKKYELALMRSMGASPFQLFTVILLEGQWIVLLGWIFSLILSRTGLFIFSHIAEQDYNFSFDEMGIKSGEVVLLVYCIVIGFVSAFIPAIRILRLQIAEVLSGSR